MLILGGTGSGKSRLAERFASDSGLTVTYIATATAGDKAMQARIARHQIRRPKAWQLCEEPIHLAKILVDHAGEDHCLLVDCLTLWLTNCLIKNKAIWTQEKQALLDSLSDLPGKIIFVSNETNMGITPMGELSRQFCDQAGHLHQQLARQCQQVIFTVAGLPQYLKGQSL